MCVCVCVCVLENKRMLTFYCVVGFKQTGRYKRAKKKRRPELIIANMAV